jgi:hypothetical protein
MQAVQAMRAVGLRQWAGQGRGGEAVVKKNLASVEAVEGVIYWKRYFAAGDPHPTQGVDRRRPGGEKGRVGQDRPNGLANGRWDWGKLEREDALSGRGSRASRQSADVARGRRRDEERRVVGAGWLEGDGDGHMVRCAALGRAGLD